MRRWLPCALSIVTVLAATNAAAQSVPDSLFVQAPATAATLTAQAGPRGEVVGMRIDRLFNGGDRGTEVPRYGIPRDATPRDAMARDEAAPAIRLNIDSHDWIAHLERSDSAINGFRTWVGAIDGIDHSHVSFVEREGIVSGLVNAVTETYRLHTIAAGVYALERGEAGAKRELEPLAVMPAAPGAAGAGQDAGGAAGGIASSAESDDASTIDVLLLYTANARTRVGGVAQINATVAQVISDSNTIYGRSGVATRVRLVGSAEVAITEAASMSTDLTTITNNPAIQGMRDTFRADLVQLLVSSPDPSACGIAWLLNSLTPGNFPGYSVADVDCLFQYTPTHEMGHNMGSHHAPEDAAAGALFPYSYGYKDPTRGFRTVMAYACSGVSCPRIPNMSNPAVLNGGAPTGTSNQNNAQSINNAANTVANFRQAGPTTITPPSAPTGLQASVNGTTVTVRWNAVTTDAAAMPAAATGYTVQVGLSPGASNVFNAPVGNTTTVSGVAPNGTYYWRVLATNSAGSSPPSAEGQFVVGGPCAAPGAPASFTFTISGRTVTLSWTAPATGGAPTTYIIEAGSATGLANLYNAPTGSTVPGAVAQAPPGTFYVRIRAQNACGTSAPSNERIIVVP